MKNSCPFSVLMPIYAGERALHLERALRSITEQSLLPSEVVVVEDGPLPASLRRVLSAYSPLIPNLRTVSFAVNRGLGAVLADGVAMCSNEIILRCDSDDINMPDRFEIQIHAMSADPNLAVLGGQAIEFEQQPGDTRIRRHVPCDVKAIRKFATWRNPMNHMTVGFRRAAIEAVGGYRHMPGYEDYYLWLRMLRAGFYLANMHHDLVFARGGRNMLQRRRGFQIARAEWRFQRQIANEGLISRLTWLRNVCGRLPVRMLPGAALGSVYYSFARNVDQNSGASGRRVVL